MRIKPGEASPVIVVLRPHEHLAQLLGYEHEHHAGDEAKHPVEAEGMLYGEWTMFGYKHIDCQEQCADEVKAPHKSCNVAGLVQPIGPSSPFLWPVIAARSSLLGRKDAFEEGLQDLHIARLKKQKQAEKCRQAKGDDAGGWRFVKPVGAAVRRQRR